MKDVRMRLLYPSSIKPEEVRAAVLGMERFRRFGVLHDCADVTEGGRAALKGVRMADAIKWMVTLEDPTITRADFRESVLGAFSRREIIPVGLTPSRMRQSVSDEFSQALEGCVGLSLVNEGAVVSAFRAREMAGVSSGGPAPSYGSGGSAELAQKSITAAIVHELGHVFGRKDHCEKGGCIMQANKDFPDFIERFVKPGLDFCGQCSGIVNSAICRMASGF